MPVSRPTSLEVEAPLNSEQAQRIEANFDRLYDEALSEEDARLGTSPIKYTLVSSNSEIEAGKANLGGATSWATIGSITSLTFSNTDVNGNGVGPYITSNTAGSRIAASFYGGRFIFSVTGVVTSVGGRTTFNGSILSTGPGTAWPSENEEVGFGFFYVPASGTGPIGPPGPQGPEGPIGPAGPDGSPGWTTSATQPSTPSTGDGWFDTDDNG